MIKLIAKQGSRIKQNLKVKSFLSKKLHKFHILKQTKVFIYMLTK